MELVGYARVSTNDQNLDLQKDALTKAGCQKIFEEKASGAKAERVVLQELLSYVRKGDTVVIWKLDRLGRSLNNLIEIANKLKGKGIELKSISENIDTSSPGGKLIFHMFASLAEFEKDIIKERTKAGLIAARARGKKGGRPAKLSSDERLMIKSLYNNKDISVKDILIRFNISKMTLYRIVK